jgi:hypothetical protein
MNTDCSQAQSSEYAQEQSSERQRIGYEHRLQPGTEFRIRTGSEFRKAERIRYELNLYRKNSAHGRCTIGGTGRLKQLSVSVFNMSKDNLFDKLLTDLWWT